MHMLEAERTEIEKPEGHYCFACGTANPIGLKLEFYRLADSICSDITLKKVHEGWENLAHGGIISTLLDEVMSWAVLYFRRVLFVTRKMKTKYVRPVLIGTPLTVRGSLIDTSEPPKVKTRGEILDDKGRLLVRSIGEFIELPEERFSSVSEGMKKEILALLENLK